MQPTLQTLKESFGKDNNRLGHEFWDQHGNQLMEVWEAAAGAAVAEERQSRVARIYRLFKAVYDLNRAASSFKNEAPEGYPGSWYSVGGTRK
ncbi:MAG: hypothetical protein MZV70_29260 [Desulfobacterales bacterium]|nr:hypothetical protein [Desulfobacterales bacterium]